MAKKLPSSVIGVDIGRHSIKTVALQRKSGNRFVLSNYAVRVMETVPETPEALGAELALVLKELSGAGNCAVAVSSSDSLIRIIEQPETPRDILRNAVRLNGLSLLNQEVKEFVLDCEKIPSSQPRPENAGPATPIKYLVAGLPRTRVDLINSAFQQYRKNSIYNLQLASVCTFNAFEFANPETFANEAFLLVDIGHRNSTVTVGVKKELVLVRAIEYGSNSLQEFLVSNSCAPNAAEALRLLDAGDENTVDHARLSLAALTREIASSIGFFEGRREENITRVLVSGGGARSQGILSIMSAELHIPCEAWDPFKSCEIAVPTGRKSMMEGDLPSLNVACGAAAEALRN